MGGQKGSAKPKRLRNTEISRHYQQVVADGPRDLQKAPPLNVITKIKTIYGRNKHMITLTEDTFVLQAAIHNGKKLIMFFYKNLNFGRYRRAGAKRKDSGDHLRVKFSGPISTRPYPSPSRNPKPSVQRPETSSCGQFREQQ